MASAPSLSPEKQFRLFDRSPINIGIQKRQRDNPGLFSSLFFCFPIPFPYVSLFCSIFQSFSIIPAPVPRPWALLAAPGRPWLLLGSSWLLLNAPGCSWAPLAAPGHPCLLLDAPGRSWLFLGCPWAPISQGSTPRHPWLLSPHPPPGEHPLPGGTHQRAHSDAEIHLWVARRFLYVYLGCAQEVG